MVEKSKCPICGDEVILKTSSETFKYKNNEKVVDGFELFECIGCKEEFINEKYFKTIKNELEEWRKSVDNLCKM